MNEEVGLGAAHRLVDAVATNLGIDAPTLAGLVAREGEGDGLLLRRRRTEAAGDRRANAAEIGQILEAHAIEERLAGRQLADVEPRGEIAVLERTGTDESPRPAERFVRRQLDDHPRRTIRIGPQHGAPVGDVAAHGAARQGRTRTFRRDDRRRRQQRGCGKQRSRSSREQAAAAEAAKGRSVSHRATGLVLAVNRVAIMTGSGTDENAGALPRRRSPQAF